jgi:type IV secretion system protein VirB8
LKDRLPKADGGLSPPVAAVAALDPQSFQAAHRRLLLLNRVLIVACVCLTACLVFLSSTISYLAPLKTTEFALVHTFGPDEQFYRVEPLSQDVNGFDIFLEKNMARWVRAALELDLPTQEVRWEEVVHMTDTALWRRLQRDHLDPGEVRKLLDQGVTRTIAVKDTSIIVEKEGVWLVAVDFTQRDFFKGEETRVRDLRAFLSVELRPRDVTKADRYLNPFGVTVVDVVLKEASSHAN